MTTRHNQLVTALPENPGAMRAIAAAYNEAGSSYLAYADGGSQDLKFNGQYAYGDRAIWAAIVNKLDQLRRTGADALRVLDMGCGPGTWLRRIVVYARAIGFRNIAARGFDISENQIALASDMSKDLASPDGIELHFDVSDLREPLSEPVSSVDLCLCLCGVLNHLPPVEIEAALSSAAQVTRGWFISSVRAAGSPPTIYVDCVERARSFHQDNLRNWLDVEFQNGRRVSVPSHLFLAAELRLLASQQFDVEDIMGLDLFHGRFAADSRWNPELPAGRDFEGELKRLEQAYCHRPDFIDRAMHLLLVARRRGSSEMMVE